MKLEEKLDKSNMFIDDMLNKNVIIKFICFLDNQVLLDTTKQLPTTIILKKEINDNRLLDEITSLLNVKMVEMKGLPFRLYNDYNKRYYVIKINKEDVLSLSNEYSFNVISSMLNEQDIKIINFLVSR